VSYLINKKHHDNSVKKINDIDGYTFKPKIKRDEYLKVTEVTVVDKEMIERILSIKFSKSFQNIVKMAMNVINDDDADEGDFEIVLDEVELLRQILLNRYQKFLNHEKEILFLKKLRLIENELRMKEVEIKRKAIFLENERKSSIRR